MGPTASGKTAFGITLAQERGGVILNADTMQCYADLRIITARPSDEELAQAEHRMYGIWSAETNGNAALWMDTVVEEIRRAWEQGKQPILLGGTGMYLKTLQDGISPIPQTPLEVRKATKERWAEDPDAFYEELLARDPEVAKARKPRDKQRLIRAMEVLDHTGKSLAFWQSQPTQSPLPEASFKELVVERDREELYARIDKRFELMVEQGAVEEVAALMEKLEAMDLPESTVIHAGNTETGYDKYSAHYPILRAHGVPELMAYIKGDMSLEDAIAKGQQNTRKYAKRQLTWIRNQCAGAEKISS